MLHIITPYRPDKDLGKAYNDAISLIPDGDFVCLMDIDAMFLTPDAPEMIEKYAEMHPDSLLTCYCNRVSPLAHEQLLGGVSENSDILHHIEKAQKQKLLFPRSTKIHRGEISGYLMVFKKDLWEQNKFDEGIGCLAVDTFWSRRFIVMGRDIIRMDAVYIWHTYRIWKDIKDKSHLMQK